MHDLLKTDSYKVGHKRMYPSTLSHTFSYGEFREGAEYSLTKFFGLQYILLKYFSKPITQKDILDAETFYNAHLSFPGNPKPFDAKAWMSMINKYKGYLPIRIRSIDEGTTLPVGNVLFTVETTDPEYPWIGQWIEPIISRVWYGSAVCTVSYNVKECIKKHLLDTGCSLQFLDYMLHDFGMRGVSSEESCGVGAAAHLVNFLGTDSFLSAVDFISDYYGNHIPTEIFPSSVAASEHSVMTCAGRDGEDGTFYRLLNYHPNEILSVVIDSYDYKNFVDNLVPKYKRLISERQFPLVLRPDSVSTEHPTPSDVLLYLLNSLARNFGVTTNESGYNTINAPIRLLWGDGIGPQGINEILTTLAKYKWAADNMATFGMGGGLLQKVNRDTLRFAIKLSAVSFDSGKWEPVSKSTEGKKSKAGPLELVNNNGVYSTLPSNDISPVVTLSKEIGLLKTRYHNGNLQNLTNFVEIRNRT